MKCITCKHGHTQPGKMTATLERGDTTIVVKEVPADICDNCGEEYLSQAISEQLLKQAEEAVKADISTPFCFTSYNKSFSWRSSIAISFFNNSFNFSGLICQLLASDNRPNAEPPSSTYEVQNAVQYEK